jgi:hypothetical protein
MGRQHELGSVALSANFGPATLAALGAGDIGRPTS